MELTNLAGAKFRVARHPTTIANWTLPERQVNTTRFLRSSVQNSEQPFPNVLV